LFKRKTIDRIQRSQQITGAGGGGQDRVSLPSTTFGIAGFLRMYKSVPVRFLTVNNSGIIDIEYDLLPAVVIKSMGTTLSGRR